MWIIFRTLTLNNKNQSFKLCWKLVDHYLILGVLRLLRALSWLQSVGIMVQKEACEGTVIDIICIESIIIPIPIHLEPDLVAHLQMEEHRARGLVYILFLILVIGEENSLVLLEEAHLHILHVHCDMVGEVVDPWDVAVEFSSAGIIVILLVVEDLSKADGNTGDSDSGLQPHTEC